MPVATMLAIAASFWSSHGYPIASDQVTWEWTYNKQHVEGIQAYAILNSNHITIVRSAWKQSNNEQRCILLIHEDGHAALGFRDVFDSSNNIMNGMADEHRAIPGTCKRKHW